MALRPRTLAPLLAAALILVLAGVVLFLLRNRPPDPGPGPEPTRGLADLGSEPAWSELEAYHGTLTRAQFEAALRDVYVLGDRWHCQVSDEAVRVEARAVPGGLRIDFANGTDPSPPPRFWRPASELGPAPEGRPLEGLRIAIDPGHIGGDFAQLEERWYRLGNAHPVAEGDMTLRTARILVPRLEALGAETRLVRDSRSPVTTSTPEDFLHYAALARPGTGEDVRREFAERLFYRTAEIRARARLVNEEIRPDLVLCLHFNAEAWGGDPRNPLFSPANHFHMILHGAYMAEELAHEDERFEMMHKVFQQVHEEEAALAAEAAHAFLEVTGLPAYRYAPGKPAIEIGTALWARNLLANRLYRCPVLFYEPYVMNNEEVYLRVQAGDYEGAREVAGQARPSIYREYAEAVVKGLVTYYETRRNMMP